MQKCVFSSTLEKADWTNSIIIRGDVATEVTKLKKQEGGNLLIWGHGLLAETVLKHHLLDVLDLSIHPLVLGRGKLFFRESQSATFRRVAAKTFTKGIVKLTYEPQY
jgi:dihydrofolate reductase